jgi:hypothetical protein
VSTARSVANIARPVAALPRRRFSSHGEVSATVIAMPCAFVIDPLQDVTVRKAADWALRYVFARPGRITNDTLTLVGVKHIGEPIGFGGDP